MFSALQKGCALNSSMEPDLNRVLFINLLFRIYLILYLSQEEKHEIPKTVKPLKQWMDPISKRVFVIFINGLQKDFLKQNSTPYLSEIVEKRGSFGVARTGYLDTNYIGFRTVLTGRKGDSFPFTYVEKTCQESILNYVGFKCGIGTIPPDVRLQCHFLEERPFDNFLKFPGLFTAKNYKSNLYIMSVDFDPIWVKDYKKRLSDLDDDIKFFASLIDSTFADNKTTYILTSARGSPIGEDLSIDSPVVAWGRGIANSEDITYMGKNDLAALLCALLGINFPASLFGIIPVNMMQLYDYYEAELTFYTIGHFEKVLKIMDVMEHLVDSPELSLDQLHTRLNSIIRDIRTARTQRTGIKSALVILLLSLWGINLISFCSFRISGFFSQLKFMFLLLIFVTVTLIYNPANLELIFMIEFCVVVTFQNYRAVFKTFLENGFVIFKTIILTFLTVTAVGLAGKLISIPTVLTPVVLWPLINDSYKRLNRFVLFTRLLSGVALGILPFCRVFGEMPDRVLVTSIGFLFLINFYFLLSIFKQKMDDHVKFNFIMILVTILCVRIRGKNFLFWLKTLMSCFLSLISSLSVFGTSGTLLSRLLNIYLSLFIPVLMLNIRIECAFYLSIVFHMFTWVFIEYHSINLTKLEFNPCIFSIKPMKSLQAVQFSSQEFRQIVFYLIYCYISYFAIGHHPDLHSYDLYVVPTFIYDYPTLVSQFLACLKFFLPFFVVTTSLIVIRGLKEKDSQALFVVSVWISDLIGSVLLFYSQIVNPFFEIAVFPARSPYFFIQQMASISVILSFFLGRYLLFCSKTFLQKVFRENKEVDENI